jgi:hypothetical protein
LFDKRGSDGKPAAEGFTAEDQRLIAAVASFAEELLRQALAERQAHGMLLDAVSAALGASDRVAETLHGTPAERRDEPPPAEIMDTLRDSLKSAAAAGPDADATLRLAEAVRVLALHHGAPAVQHCIRLVEDLRTLLDSVTGYGK